MVNLAFETKVKNMIDDLKALCNTYGLGGTGYEYKIISELFTYKLLNDKLLNDLNYNSDTGISVQAFLDSISDEEYQEFLDFLDPNTAKLKKDQFISHLFNNQNKENFDKILDNTLIKISDLNKEVFSIETSGGQRKGLFEPISVYVTDIGKREGFCKAIINKIAQFSFQEMFTETYDFYSSIFEYLISDYNKDSGRYAEYYTPVFCANIISELLVDGEVSSVKIYDPSAGSGTLLMSLAHKIGVDKCSIYSQDISQKSSDFLRLNLILNNLVHSLHNVIQGDTLVEPYHKDGMNLKKFDYIVSNPPFKMDFSDTVNTISADSYNRFFAGVPTVPAKKKDGMPIYLLFMQHIISSLSAKGKACIVVPSGFCTDSGAIPTNIRKYLIQENWLKGVIQMPSNIFANTNTSISLIFIDKDKENEDIIFIDASNVGKKEKIKDVQKTVLSPEDTKLIINTFKQKEDIKEFSKVVDKQTVIQSDYMIKSGLYFGLDYKKISKFNCNTQEQVDNLRIKLNSLYRQLENHIARELFIKWFIDYEYPNSSEGQNLKESELGFIPLDWSVVKLSDLISDTIGGEWGKEFPEKNYTIEVKCIRGTDIPNIMKGEYENVPTRYVMQRHIDSKLIQEGDIIIEISGGSPTQSTGRLCYISKETIDEIGYPLLCTNFCRIIRFKDKLHSKIVFTYLTILYDKGYFFNLENNTTGIKNLLMNIFSENIKLALPANTDLIVEFYEEIKRQAKSIKLH